MTITIDEYKTLIDIISRNTETERPPRRSPTKHDLYQLVVEQEVDLASSLIRVQHHILTELRKQMNADPYQGWGDLVDQWIKENE